MAGGHNTHASGIGQRKGKRHTHTGNRACKWRSPDNFATANLTHLQQYDLSVAASAAPSEEEIIKVRGVPSFLSPPLIYSCSASHLLARTRSHHFHTPPNTPPQSMLLGKWSAPL